MPTIKAVLFDLDNTLLDRKATFLRYCDHLITFLFPPQLTQAERMEIRDFLVKADNNGYRNREDLYDRFIALYNLPCPPDFLQAEWTALVSRESVPMPGLYECLETLSARYPLGIITNGSGSTQNAKIDALGIRHYFRTIRISGDCGIEKPDARIFWQACEDLHVLPCETIFVGDHWGNDIAGASDAGLRAVYLHPSENPSGVYATIKSLHALQL